MAFVSVKIVHAGCAHMVGFMWVRLWIFDGVFRTYWDGKNGYAVRLQILGIGGIPSCLIAVTFNDELPEYKGRGLKMPIPAHYL